MLRTADLEYELPGERIAMAPVSPRDAARLMVVEREEGGSVQDRVVRDLPRILRTGDLLVFNTTRVLPARFVGRRVGSGGKIEGLYLADVFEGKQASGMGHEARGVKWQALIKGRHTRAGAEIEVLDRSGRPGGVLLRVVGRSEDEAGAWVVELSGASGTVEALERVGLTPLPPYILAARKRNHEEVPEQSDRERYQTVYAGEAGSVAAPTAGLHFTRELLAALSAAGVGRADVVLHVGSGTFRGVETEFVEQHPMHEEWCSMSPEAARAIAQTRERGRRVIAVGTTAARTIEAHAEWIGLEARPPESIRTRLLVTPGYRWRWVDGLMTNFHLPRTTLMALVAAMLEGDGVGRLKSAYGRAIEGGYRFYSYGDAMVLLPT